jgi:ribosomal protein S18 acetylase RimI-like enzyme
VAAASSKAIALRRAVPADAAALAAFERRSFVGSYAAHRFSDAQFRFYLGRPATIAHVIASPRGITAYALGIQNTGSRRHIARLYSIAVAPAARDHRVGARVLRAFLAEARRRKCRVAYLEVAADNGRAIALFTRHGFGPTRRLRAFYGPDADGLRMRCDL